MAISQKLGIRQTQQLTMTPELQQSIKLLQLAALDLRAFVNAEIESNPLLELAQQEDTVAEARPTENRDNLETQFAKTNPSNAASAFDGGAENLTGVFSDSLSPLRGQAGAARSEAFNPTDNVAGQPTLRDHIRGQIGMMSNDPAVEKLALVLVEELDDDGYLRIDEDDFSRRLGVTADMISQARTVVMGCEPAGVGAANLAECLRVQLIDQAEIEPDTDLVLDHLDDLAHTPSEKFAKTLGLSQDRLARILEQLKILNAAPGLIFDRGITEYAIPEVSVDRNNLGGWSVELNTATLPRVLINNQYSALVKTGDDATVEFMTSCAARARWLVNSLDQRARTILRVAAEIVRLQDDFFDFGVSALKPMTLRDVADNLSIHESTVSRVTSGKYLVCERGTFELKFFFSTGVGVQDGGDAHSSRSVQDKIRRLIDGEPANKVYSDERIVQALASDGINIARRTVTKYREAMRIPSSVRRRRDKASKAKNTA